MTKPPSPAIPTHDKKKSPREMRSETKRNRRIVGLAVTGVAALCVPVYQVLLGGRDDGGRVRGGGGGAPRDWWSSGDEGPEDSYEDDARDRARLLQVVEGQDSGEDFPIPDWILRLGDDPTDEELDEAMDVASSALPFPAQADVAPYTIADAVGASSTFTTVYGVLVYDPPSDSFMFVYSDKLLIRSGLAKLSKSFKQFVSILRATFPERFCGAECPEFAVGVSSGDYPHLSRACYDSFPHPSADCVGTDAPILQFGSVFHNDEILRNTIAMPMPVRPHLTCFKAWVGSEKRDFSCPDLSKASDIGTGSGLTWEDLIPQVVWRGTDFGYLNHILHKHPFSFKDDLAGKIESIKDDAQKEDAIRRIMAENYDNVYPRWKGYLLTHEADHEAKQEGKDALPWANIRFTASSPAARVVEWDDFAEHGVQAKGERMSLTDLAKYKYHIDLGGGGGTTWTGTMAKLALPGLLFHHMTAAKDYIHDHMKPWIHYVPVRTDLKDLRAKFEWAESHPKIARKIAERGSDLMRTINSNGFEAVFDGTLADPMRKLFAAYQPVPSGSSWRDAVKATGVPMTIRMACNNKQCDQSSKKVW